MNIQNMTINKVRALYKKETTLKELNQEIFNLAKTVDNKYNLFISLDDEHFENTINRLSSIKTGEEDSLFGIPAVLGDNICTEQLKTTCGSKILENYLSPFNAFAVDKLREAGVIITGKTNIDE
ncbi:MAG: Asp-tRNA(Asn)/Glu-tRNA(Gln) amidotransferase GatCAB subunit A, partial [Firmicutes bacterium HGW-Firmicutes-13]